MNDLGHGLGLGRRRPLELSRDSELGRYAKAEADATKAFNLDPSSAKALYRRGLARVGAGGKVEQARAGQF